MNSTTSAGVPSRWTPADTKPECRLGWLWSVPAEPPAKAAPDAASIVLRVTGARSGEVALAAANVSVRTSSARRPAFALAEVQNVWRWAAGRRSPRRRSRRRPRERRTAPPRAGNPDRDLGPGRAEPARDRAARRAAGAQRGQPASLPQVRIAATRATSSHHPSAARCRPAERRERPGSPLGSAAGIPARRYGPLRRRLHVLVDDALALLAALTNRLVYWADRQQALRRPPEVITDEGN